MKKKILAILLVGMFILTYSAGVTAVSTKKTIISDNKNNKLNTSPYGRAVVSTGGEHCHCSAEGYFDPDELFYLAGDYKGTVYVELNPPANQRYVGNYEVAVGGTCGPHIEKKGSFDYSGSENPDDIYIEDTAYVRKGRNDIFVIAYIYFEVYNWDHVNSKWVFDHIEQCWDEFFETILFIGGCCFPAGTKITMADGSHKNIEDVKVGDNVFSYNLENNKFSSWRVKMLGKPVHPVMTINNGLVQATVDHPFYIKKSDGIEGWAAYDPVDAATAITYNGEVLNLEIGDQLYSPDGEWIEITELTYNPEPIQTYNKLSFSGTKTYFANDVLVYEEHPPHGMTNYFLRLLGEKFPWLEQFLLSSPLFNKLLRFLP